MEKLEDIGAFSLLCISPDDIKIPREQRSNGDESDSVSDYDNNALDTNSISDNDKLNSFLLSKNDQTICTF